MAYLEEMFLIFNLNMLDMKKAWIHRHVYSMQTTLSSSKKLDL